MSLINEALKRARQVQRHHSPSTPRADEPVLRPVEKVVSPQVRRPPWRLLTGLVGLVVVAFALWEWYGGSAPTSPSGAVPLKSHPGPTLSPARVASKPVGSPLSGRTVGAKPRTSLKTPLVVAGRPPSLKPLPPGSAAGPARPASATEQGAEAKGNSTESGAKPKPTSLSPAPAPAFPALQMQGVFYRKRDPSVLINGRILREGDQIDGVRIEQIGAESVIVEFRGRRRKLSLR